MPDKALLKKSIITPASSENTGFLFGSSIGPDDSTGGDSDTLVDQAQGDPSSAGNINLNTTNETIDLQGFNIPTIPSNATNIELAVSITAIRTSGSPGTNTNQLTYQFTSDLPGGQVTVTKLSSTFPQISFFTPDLTGFDTFTSPNFTPEFFNNFVSWKISRINDPLIEDEDGNTANNTSPANTQGNCFIGSLFISALGEITDNPQIQISYDIPEESQPTKIVITPKIGTTDFQYRTFLNPNASNAVITDEGTDGTLAITFGNQGTIRLSNEVSEGNQLAGIIGINARYAAPNETTPFTTFTDLNGFIPGGWLGISSITTRFLYRFNNTLSSGEDNKFTMGWGYNFSAPTAQNIADELLIDTAEETVTESEGGIIKLATHVLNADGINELFNLASNDGLGGLGALTRSRFIIRYTDDNPDNSLDIFGQSADPSQYGQSNNTLVNLGLIDSNSPLATQRSLEFEVAYPATIFPKVKLGFH
jgi:hypothetical protein